MGKFIGSRQFYKKLLWLAVPIMIQNAITNFVGFLDNIMVGRLGTEQMSGVAIVNQFVFVFNLFIFGGLSGAGIFGAQFYGSRDYKGIRDTFRFKLIIGIIVAEDLYFPQVLQTLSVCGAEIALCIFEELNETLEQTLMRASAYYYGIPVSVCACGYAQASDIAGKVCFASPQSPCFYDFEREQEYHLVEIRQRGITRRKRSGF